MAVSRREWVTICWFVGFIFAFCNLVMMIFMTTQYAGGGGGGGRDQFAPVARVSPQPILPLPHHYADYRARRMDLDRQCERDRHEELVRQFSKLTENEKKGKNDDINNNKENNNNPFYFLSMEKKTRAMCARAIGLLPDGQNVSSVLVLTHEDPRVKSSVLNVMWNTPCNWGIQIFTPLSVFPFAKQELASLGELGNRIQLVDLDRYGKLMDARPWLRSMRPEVRKREEEEEKERKRREEEEEKNKKNNDSNENSKEKQGENENEKKKSTFSTEDWTLMDYSYLMTSTQFWKDCHGDYVLIFQTDVVMCSGAKANVSEFTRFDYVGAPWAAGLLGFETQYPVGNGGFSLRNRHVMEDIASRYNYNPYQGILVDDDTTHNEDVWFVQKMYDERFRMPTQEEASRFAVESVYYPSPIGLHKPNEFLSSEQLLETFLHCPELRSMFHVNMTALGRFGGDRTKKRRLMPTLL